jgi:hypothetical protein
MAISLFLEENSMHGIENLAHSLYAVKIYTIPLLP